MTQSTFLYQVANKLLMLLQGYSKTIRLLLVMFLTLTASTAWAEDATLSFASTAQRVSQTAAKQVWSNGGITFTNNKASSTTNVANYSKPVRLYANSEVIVEHTSGKMTKIVFDCNSNAYASTMKTSIGTVSGTTVTVSSDKVTVNFTSAVASFTVAKLSGQIRLDAITVTYTSGGSVTPDPCTTPTVAWNTKPANGEVGGSMTASVTTNYSNGLTYSSSNQTVATVTNAGFINYLSAGTTTITATVTGDGTTFCEGPVSVQQEITVTAPAGGGGGDGECSWTLVADASTLKVDDEVIITASGSTTDNNYALSTNQKSNNRAGAAITKNGNTLTAPSADVQILTLKAGSTSGTFAFYTGTSGYLYAASSSANQLKTKATLDAHGSWTISITDGVASIVAEGSSNRNVMQYNYNNGSPLFACYASASQTSLAIYKKICSDDGGDEPTPTKLDKPTNLKVSDVNTTTATLSWDAVANASGYTVVVGSTSHNTNTTSITVENLTASTTYKWSVTAKGNGSTYTDSDAAKGSDFTTETTAPTNYTVTLNPNYPAGKTGVFIDTLSSTVSGNLEISLPAGTKSQAITKLYKSIALEGYIFEGWYEAADGDAHRENTGDILKDITFYAHWRVPYTVTFDAGTGTCTGSITETTANGIQLPTATLTDCDDWTFLGWAETAIESETKDAPASFLAGGSTYKPTDDITLYAIYKRVEGGGNGEGTAATLTFDNTSKRTTLTTEQQVWTENGITLTNNKASSTSNVADYSNPARFYAKSEIIISAPANINKIVANCSKGASDLVSSVGAEASNSNNAVTIFPTSSNTTFTIAQLSAQVQMSSITVTYGGGLSTSYYHSKPVCQTCENILTISKGAETNGTFTLNISGDIETCETEVSVVVKPTPANHYHIGSVTATAPTKGGAPTVIDNDNGTYTITYAANSTGTSTINVTFAEDAKATIKLYELGVLKTIATEYVGDKYTLPSTSSQSCGTKTLVGWSTVAFAETDTRPTENYYGISTQITLAETQTFYAVFAQSNGGGGGNGDYARVTEALGDWSGDYLIAYNDQTFANGSTGGTSGMGAKGNKQDLSSSIENNTIPASIGDLYNVTLVTVDGGYVLQTKDGKYNYYTSGISNGLSATESLETAKNYPIVIDFISSEDIELHITKNEERLNSVFSYNTLETGYFRFYKEGGQEPVYLYKKSGTAATYTGYTTSCAVITGVEVANPKTEFKQYDEFVFGGTVYAVDENDNRIDVTSSATFSGYDMKKAGTDTVTVTYLTHSITYEITIEKVNAYSLTWNVSGATNTGLAPAYVVPGSAIGKLPTPKEIPAGCEGKTFVGWTESNTVNSDGTEITFITSSTVPTQNTTYYAVFATPSGNAGDGNYVKLTETPADLSGEYLIVYEEGNLAFNGGLTTLDAIGNTIAVTINDNTIASTDATNAAKFTIAKDGEGDYTIKSVSGKYIGRTANDNDLDEDESTPYKNTITFTDGDVNIIASGGAYLRYNKNSGAERFRYYKSKTYTQQQPIALYKKSGSSASYTDYTTGCHDVTITYYGFTGGYTTNCGGSDLNVITQRVNSSHTIPTCTEITDPTDLGRTFLNLWKDQNGKEHKPGESFIVTQDITLYAQWRLETTNDVELRTDVVDLATTDIVVTGGTTLTLPAGTTTINSLTLEGGRTSDGYLTPAIYSDDEASVELTNKTIYFDLSVDMANYYPFAVPFPVAVNQVDYADPTLARASSYGTHYVIKRYDGANRAENGENKNANWVKVEETETLQPGIGYIITAVPIGDEALIRFPMTITTPLKQTEQSVTVTAHTGTATDINNGGHQRHAGWNFIANPYLSRFAGVNVGNENNLLKGVLNYVNGEWQKTGEVPYVTIPAPDFSYYEQVELDNAILSPSYAFFVQAAQTATLSFATASRQQNMPALRAAAVEPLRLPLMLTQATASDRTTLLVSDDHTPAYEIGKDLEKMFGSAEQVSLYAWSSNTPLAYCAVPWASAIQAIPLGYRARQAGSVTIELSNTATGMDDVASVLLYDQVTGLTTNLLINSYTFETEMGTHDARFTVMITPKQGATTGCEEVMLPTDGTYKFLRNGQLYINHRGTVYTVEGRESW